MGTRPGGRDLVVKRGDQLVGRHRLLLGHLGENVPHHVLQADAGKHAVNLDSAGRCSYLDPGRP